jgi:serine/threonine protein kinase
MRPEFRQVKDIFLAAIEKTHPDEREAFLREACAENDALRRQVDGLLRRHEDAGSFLEHPPLEDARMDPIAPNSVAAAPPAMIQTESVGMKISHYMLVQQLGEGGMGTVWVAEQTEPVKRRVALKVIKPGLDSAQVIRRFEAERQALALMDHSNIAKVFDAGTTAAGRPYFVMELVKGLPITRYCDELQLPLRERLELLVPVCQAIQHAHQQGVIHRDIKPSNVLVSIQDGKPVPKVIDFGVAKAVNQRLADATMYTEIGQLVGTVEYMPPEQAELSALGVDSRADVYALGVLLYELVTGTTPLDKSRLRSAAFTEMLRIIKEVEPPLPSTRLTESKSALPSLAAQRRTEPRKLASDVRGELDWIVMRCLEKDRTRRYKSASSLARDIERHLHDEPVEACPPRALYRLGKLLRRNKRRLIAATIVLTALIAAMGVTLGSFLLAERERRRALVAAALADMASIREMEQVRDADRSRQIAEDQKRLADLSEARAIAEKQKSEAVLSFLKHDLLSQGNPAEEANANELESKAVSLLQAKRYADAEQVIRAILSIRTKTEPDAWTTSSTKSMLGEALAGQKNDEGALPLLLAGYNELKARESTIPADEKHRLNEAAQRLVRFYEAAGNHEKAEEWRKKVAALGGEKAVTP